MGCRPQSGCTAGCEAGMAPGSRDAQDSGRRVLTWRINYLLLQNKLSPTCPLETVGMYYPAGPMGQKPGPDVDGAAASQGVRVGGPFPAAVPGPGPLLAAGCGQGSSLGLSKTAATSSWERHRPCRVRPSEARPRVSCARGARASLGRGCRAQATGSPTRALVDLLTPKHQAW